MTSLRPGPSGDPSAEPRSPVWFPVDVLLADKLRTYGRHFGSTFTIEIPTGSGQQKTLVVLYAPTPRPGLRADHRRHRR